MKSLRVAAVFLLLGGVSAHGEEPGAILLPRSLTASRIDGSAPIVDGRLDDAAWAAAQVATDFVERRPHPGAVASLRTEARLLYDERALYVAVRAFDPEPERILAPWPRRDDETTSDWIFVEIDSRRDRRTAVSLGVNPRGVQVDGVFFADVQYDTAWDAVWESAARIDDAGWTAEFRIPFSQLPYSAAGAEADDGTADAVWGLNVYRNTPHAGATSNWSPRLPSLAGVVSNFNDLHLRVPKRLRRLEAAPYVAGSLADGSDDDGADFAAGGDLKAGLGSSFTLSAAIHPDFTQVEADPSEVNLTAFETFFSERRPLFVENASLLSFDSSLPLVTRGNSFGFEQPFYSRRIGADGAPIRAALKLTGRTTSGWSAGGLGASTAHTAFASTRVSRDFRGGRSALGVFASGVARSEGDPLAAALRPDRAFSAGLDGRHRFAGDVYEVTGHVLASRIEGTEEAVAHVLRGPGHYLQRPDREGSGDFGTTASGFGGQLRFARVGGDHWHWAVAGHALSPRLELNDLGFQRNADWLVALGSVTYQDERPGRVFRRWSLGSNQLAWGWSFGGERRAAVLNATGTFDLHNYWGGSLSFDHERPALQVEALRGGPALLMPPRDAGTVQLYSDTRRASQATLAAQAYQDHGNGSFGWTVAPAVLVRLSDRLSFSVGPTFERTVNAWQFVSTTSPSGPPIVARLDQTNTGVTTRVDLAFSSKLTLQLYAQPFRSHGDYSDYGAVVAPRAPRTADRVSRLPEPTGDDADFRVTDLRANLVLRWEYRPGSALFVVWTQARHDERITDPERANVLLAKLSYRFGR
jgi:hypothetical protein